MEYVRHVISYAINVGVCECVASSRLRRLLGSSSSGISSSTSNVMVSTGDSSSEVTCVSGVDSVGEFYAIAPCTGLQICLSLIVYWQGY